MNIDWSKAPEGATHYGVATYSNGSPDWCEAFYRREMGGIWRICFPFSNDWHGDASRNEDWAERFSTLIKRPETWNGEGLPPVGTVCTIECDTPHKRWKKHVGQRVVIVAHSTGYEGNPTAVYKVFDAEDSEYHALRERAFRPIRTPEQIAAEERKAAVAEMSNATQGAKDWAEAFRMLYNAGYRKFEIVKEDV